MTTRLGADDAIGLEELRGLSLLHAQAQGIEPGAAQELLARITEPWGDRPRSWGRVWCAEGDRLAGQGLHLEASRHYAMARFPYPGDAPRQEAQRRCVAAFDTWRAEQNAGIERLEVPLEDGTAVCWTAGLSATDPKPLIVVMGGIVSVKEQWAPLLVHAEAFGVALAVTELPGVGENTVPYGPRSPRMLSAILDALSGRADVSRTAAIALSFGGHLALRCALVDSRLACVATVGAPLRLFFEDEAWQRQVPRTTLAALAHTTGVPPSLVFGYTRGWGLTDQELGALRIPVHYIAALRDEIVPLGEAAVLRRAAVPGEVTVLDDVHGAPAHLDHTRGLLLGAALAAAAPAAPGAVPEAA
ncbi:alpha/beta hydrolase [Streptomyces sp. RKAG293]|uniref:alpha/beta hydrolase n=1 Tax=Streptomyces sp. RKAG293 TaxID=2893403 RepID=UPI0020349F1B|nr:alpha/beta hydrolase [Streptomyces sp. RKAG293]MCM2423282.1 esterase FrsA [Streptomyces sp. RKAG293]